jgi:hypothetical protein
VRRWIDRDAKPPNYFYCMKMLVASILCLAWLGSARSAPDEGRCSPSKQRLRYYADPSVDRTVAPGFADELADSLTAPLHRIGYCLVQGLDHPGVDSTNAGSMIVYLAALGEQDRDDTTGRAAPVLLVSLIRANRLSEAHIEKALAHPLVAIEHIPESAATLRAVMVRKILENLRTAYVSYLIVESDPSGARITTQSGLRGVSPVEWVFPLSRVAISARMEGHRDFEKTVDLTQPGHHQLHIQLTRRRFYHSRMLIPAAGFLALAAGAFAAEYYYYNQYESLGERDYYENPESFGHLFDRARLFEGIGFFCAGAAGLSLTLSFWL